MRTKKIVYGGILLAMGILLPQAFHLTGVPQSGMVFLPMHIPVIIAGFLLGPAFGLLIGILTPLISSLITAMPAMDRLPFMMAELVLYGFVSGLLFHNFKFKNKRFGIYITLIISMLAGRMGYAIMLFFAAGILNLPVGGPMAAVAATVTGLPGIAVQIILIPILIYALRKGGRADGNS